MILVLTGAGISKESGIATFRDSDGLWEQERIEDVATPGGFRRDPNRVYSFYNARRRQLQEPQIAPNAAHKALARLERESCEPVLIVTQNVDNLHERAGSANVLHMHGELMKARCGGCHGVYDWQNDFDASTVCPACGKAGHMRPHIVWFEEMPLGMRQIEEALAQCHLFVSIGTSGNVYPAAGFSQVAKAHGARLIELNLEPSLGASIFHDGRYGPATETVPQWVREILAAQK